MTYEKELPIPNDRFDSDQTMEINMGIADGLDVSVYADPQYMAIQMRQIRLGMQEGLDVSVYAKPEYDWFQMEEIRKGMLQKINYMIYAMPSVEYRTMRQIRLGLQDGLDLSSYIKLDAGILCELRKALLSRANIISYIKKGYQVEQLREIRRAIEKKLDISKYLIKEFRGAAIREICQGLEDGLDPAIYAKIDFSWRQMREIRLGLEKRLNVEIYANPLFDWKQMREIRLGLEAGIDVSSYRSFMYTAADMKRMREEIVSSFLEGILSPTKVETDYERFSIFTSADQMESMIEIKCSESETVSREEVMHALERQGITYGILEEAVDELLEKKRYNVSVVIAKGKLPTKGEDGWYEFFFHTENKKKPNILPDGSADYKNIQWFEMVEKGQKIAVYHSAQSGEDGYTVTGKKLPALYGQEKNVLTGEGFELQPDRKTYVAAVDGRIELLGENQIYISKMLVLDEVTATSGNIDFDGCIYVKGNVGAGSVIKASQDIVIYGFVEAATIQCEGDIVIGSGANGGGEGLIKAGGRINGQFFEAIHVISGENIYANYCLNCLLQAGDSIMINGKKGMLAGGYAQAAFQLKVHQLGNHIGIETNVQLGIDSVVLQKKAALESQLEEEHKELSILGNAYIRYQKKYPPEIRNTMEIYIKVEQAIYTIEEEIKNLQEQLKEIEEIVIKMQGAKAVVEGELYEGTTIYLHNNKWKAFQVRNVEVVCKNGRVVVHSM